MSTPHPPRENFDKPTAARVYHGLNQGHSNYAIDRTFIARAVQICPFLPDIAKQNRGFLLRAARSMAEAGIDQFLDIGAGVPDPDLEKDVHRVVHEVNPDAVVVYADNDYEALVSWLKLLQGNNKATAISGDLRDPESIVDNAAVRAALDFDRPVGLLVVAVLHFVPDEDEPHELIRRYLDMLSPGSYFAASHVSAEDLPSPEKEQLEALKEFYSTTANPAILRSRAEFRRFFGGLEFISPEPADDTRDGVAYAADWRAIERVAADDPARPSMLAAVGRKP